MKPTAVSIDPKSVAKSILVILAFLLAWKIRFIILSFLAAFILMSGAALLVDWLHKRGVNRTFAALLTYLLLLIFLAASFFLIIPPVIKEIQQFVQNLPDYAKKLDETYKSTNLPAISNEEFTRIITSTLNSVLGNVLSFLLTTVNGVFTFLTIAILSFYLLMERDKFKNNISIFFPHLPKERVTNLAYKVEKRIGAWFRGELILMFCVGAFTFLGLTLLRVEYALPLAIIAGLLEAVAIVGPIISAVPAVLITLVTDPLAAIGVIALYIIIQQLENNLLVPKIMEGTVGLSPLVTILVLLVGASLFGIAGAILAVPTSAIVAVIVEDFRTNGKS